jgi:hypothetical protein
MPQRLAIILVAAAVGAIFATGLFVHGWVGGVLLLVTAAVLAGLTRLLWNRVRPQGRPLRLLVVAAITVIGIIKIVHG